ncbi:MAG: sulfotransferase domain-containing protein [Pseudomonadota bacterium]
MTAQNSDTVPSSARSAASEAGFSGPNFFIVGAPKCGTTAWATYLAGHPEIFAPSAKEPHYFNTDHHNYRWAKTRLAYLHYYKDYGGEKVALDASVQYLCSVDAARNIAEFDPQARVLIMLRKPSTFIRSYHNQLLMNFDETIEDLPTAWSLSGQRPDSKIPPENREPSFLDYKRVGLFSEQVARYLEIFKRSQVMVVFMEDWTQDPRTLYLQLMEVLGLEDDGRTEFPQVHAAKHVSNRTLHRLTQRPPSTLKTASRLLRRLPGMGAVKPARVLRRLNSRKGYGSEVADAALAKEIDAYFENDQERLRALLGNEQ